MAIVEYCLIDYNELKDDYVACCYFSIYYLMAKDHLAIANYLHRFYCFVHLTETGFTLQVSDVVLSIKD